LDMAKYRSLFLEEAVEHLAEMSRALLSLEKDPADGQAIDLVFRMAHSIKGMSASLGYEAISELSHRLEDRMARVRAAGRVEASEELDLLLRGLAGLERMVEQVRETGEGPPPEAGLLDALSRPAPEAPLKKKA
jgi:two-component system, chemotaxis family, sensor kinase CheA